MAKWHGVIGFCNTTETLSGIWVMEPTERYYFGDVLSRYIKTENGEGLNDNITINNKISVVADSFARNNIGYMKYVSWSGSLWEINSIEVQYPRLILTVGGLYNGPTPKSTNNS